MSKRSYTTSQTLHERACRSLAGGISSEFRRAYSLFYARGEGSRIWDVDGNEYLDFTLSQGPLILGHSHPEVLESVEQASRLGQIFAGQYEQELELAEKLQAMIPCAELLRFSLSGSEADHAALRLARAATGRPKFLRFEGHYHGWFDGVAFGISAPSLEAMGEREHPCPTPWTEGLPSRVFDDAILLPWNDLALLEKTLAAHHTELSAIIMEPVMCNNGCISPEPGFLEGVRALCDRYGILLIFDEVITGFRLGMGGAQSYFNVVPDLAVFGKAMANGYPISVLAGKQKYMSLIAEGRVIHAGTMNSGNPCVAAAMTTLNILERDRVHDRLYTLGNQLMEGLRAAARDTGQPLRVQGLGPVVHTAFTTQKTVREYRDTFHFDKPLYHCFLSAMQERGIRLVGRGIWYLSAAHTPADIEQAIATAYEVLKDMGTAEA